MNIKPLDSARSRFYLAPAVLWLTLDSGKFDQIRYNPKTKSIQITLDKRTTFTPSARLHISQPARKEKVGIVEPVKEFKHKRGAYVIPLDGEKTEITLK